MYDLTDIYVVKQMSSWMYLNIKLVSIDYVRQRVLTINTTEIYGVLQGSLAPVQDGAVIA
jgi:hypothetical protein